MDSLLLIYPPLAKNCEPPAGIARLAGFLRGNGVSCTTLDVNRLGFEYLLNLPCGKSDTWSQRAVKNVKANIAGLQESRTYAGFDRYKRMVADVNRVLSCVGEERGIDLSLANYQDASFSPVQSADLCRAVETCQDNIFYPFYVDCLIPILERQSPHYIGISITYLSQAVVGFALLGFLRKRFPEIRIILGGGLVTSWMRSPLWQNPFNHLVDRCIAGPGEQPLFELLCPDKKISRLFPPVYDETNYLAPGFILPYAASSGCYWNKCLFCPETAEENPYIPLPVTQVMADLDVLVERYKPKLIHFLDNAVSPALMTALTERESTVLWYGFARICPQLADEDFCSALRRSGCVMLKLGLESGDQHVLDAMHKGIERSLAARVLKALKAAGILTYVYLLFGTPSEDESRARRTMDFTIQHHDEIGFLNLAIFNLPLGGPEAAHLVVNEFYSGDLSLYTDFVHPKGWSRRNVRSFLNRNFKRQPEILAILQCDPPLFTSNHAPLFHPSFQRL